MGVLFYSQSRFEEGKAPLCSGVSRRARKSSTTNVSSETVPAGGSFKYFCVGASSYDPDALRSASKDRRHPGDPVEVPFCSGVEIISAAAVSHNRELLPAEGGAEASLARHKSDKRAVSDVPLRNPLRHQDWDGFQERFARVSHSVFDRMCANASYMARMWRQIFRER